MPLKIIVGGNEFFNSAEQTFFKVPKQTLLLEHSLVSLSKWESRWNKPFLGDKTRTNEESIDYVRCMTMTSNVDESVYKYCITNDIMSEVARYIESPMTATTIIEENNRKTNSEKLTSEVIYSMMIDLGIPFECEKWHLNRLIMLIRVCAKRNSPPKKMSKKDVLSKYASLNAARRKSSRR